MPEAPSSSTRVTAWSILTDPLVGPVIAVVFVFLTGFGLVFPVMPLFARSFGVGNDGAGFFVATFGFARLFGDLIGGSIVDRKGERWTALVGTVALTVFVSATAAAPSFVIALAFWGLAGIGSAVVFASLFSYILKAAPPDRVARTLSYFYGAFNIGVIAGGSAGGFIADAFGLAAPLFSYSIVLIVSFLVYARFVRDIPSARKLDDVADRAEAVASQAPLPSDRIVRDLLRVPGFLTTLFLNLCYLWIVGSIFSTLVPLFATDEIGMSTAAIGAMFAIGVAAEFVILFPAGAFSDRYGRKAVVVPALAALAVMTAAIGFSSTPVMLTVMLALLAFSSGFAGVPPAAMLSDIVPTEHSGRGVGAFRFAGDVGLFLGPLIAGVVSETLGFRAAFAITATVPVVALVLALRTKETLRSRRVATEV